MNFSKIIRNMGNKFRMKLGNKSRMKMGDKFLSKIIIIQILATIVYPVEAAFGVTAPVTKAPPISAKAYIIMEAGSGKVLLGSNIHQQRHQASTTKITTAIVALEQGKLTDKVIISKHADDTPEEGLWLAAGEQFTLKQMMYALLLFSANDAATAIAEHIGAIGLPKGTSPEKAEEHFVSLMNAKAAEIGARDSHYANPHGLDNVEHYSSAYDLALLARYGLTKVPGFAGLVSTKKEQIPWDGHPYPRVLNNRNKLLTTYPGANGVKTGFTDEAGRCLVSSAKRGELQLIAVVMDSPDIFKECSSLLDWGFANYRNIRVTDSKSQYGTIKVEAGLKDRETVFPAKSLTLPVPIKSADSVLVEGQIPAQVQAPVVKGQKLGVLRVTIPGEGVQTVDLIAGESIGKKSIWQLLWEGLLNWLNSLFGK